MTSGAHQSETAMQDTELTPSPSVRRRGRGGAAIIAALVLAAGAGTAWYAWQNGWIEATLPAPPDSAETDALPVVSPSHAAQDAAAEAAIAGTGAKVAALEQRLMELNQQAIAASANATHAEALMVAFATRRAIDRGAPLGYLETQLRLRFGDSQPNAVDRIITASAKPVTLPTLSESFARLEPDLAGGSSDEGAWTWIKREIGGLFVIRRGDMPSPTPQSRLERTRAALAGGRVDEAVLEVERMPGRAAATEWLANARDFMMTQRALDQIEAAALAPAPAVAMPASAQQSPVPAATSAAVPTSAMPPVAAPVQEEDVSF